MCAAPSSTRRQENWVGQFMANAGAVLRSPSGKFDGDDIAVMIMDAAIIKLENFVWRPPWLGFGRFTQAFSRRKEVERDKRKPPWLSMVEC